MGTRSWGGGNTKKRRGAGGRDRVKPSVCRVRGHGNSHSLENLFRSRVGKSGLIRSRGFIFVGKLLRRDVARSRSVHGNGNGRGSPIARGNHYWRMRARRRCVGGGKCHQKRRDSGRGRNVKNGGRCGIRVPRAHSHRHRLENLFRGCVGKSHWICPRKPICICEYLRRTAGARTIRRNRGGRGSSVARGNHYGRMRACGGCVGDSESYCERRGPGIGRNVKGSRCSARICNRYIYAAWIGVIWNSRYISRPGAYRRSIWIVIWETGRCGWLGRRRIQKLVDGLQYNGAADGKADTSKRGNTDCITCL